MSDKYPSLSPYVYCADNPVKLVDPNGEEIINPYKKLLEEARNDITTAQNRLNTLREGTKEFKAAKQQLNAAKSNLKATESNYLKVEQAIGEVKKFNNVLYNRINNLKDEDNQTVDVYITIDKTLGSDMCGKSFINRENGAFYQFDLDHRISTIRGVIVSLNPNADSDVGLTLSHEFGHIDYIVPNTTEYSHFLNDNNLNYAGYNGHNENPLDKSGKSAYDAERTHRTNRRY